MKNISATEKEPLRKRMFQLGVQALERERWKIERVQGIGKSSVRKIVRGDENKLATIRTTQDTWISFTRNKSDSGWITLDDVDQVVAVSVDDQFEPKFVQVHIIDGDDMRDRFDRAYKARKEAGHSLPRGWAIWVPLYYEEAEEPVTLVGAGAGLAHPTVIPPVPLENLKESATGAADEGEDTVAAVKPDKPDESLTIAEAKRRLALTLGVEPLSIKITVEA